MTIEHLEALRGRGDEVDPHGSDNAHSDQDGAEQQDQQNDLYHWRRNQIMISAGGVATAVLATGGCYLAGMVSGAEAAGLLDAVKPSTRFLTSGVMTSTATIMALLLTLLSVSRSSDRKLRPLHYRRIDQTALLCAVTLIASILLLGLHSVPVRQADEIPGWLYPAAYYLLIGASGVVIGLMVAIVLQLYFTLRDMVAVFWPEKSSVVALDPSESD